MTFECKDLDRALEVPELMKDAREHARNCPACNRDLWIWGEMSSAAAGLREEWESPALWGSIRGKLALEPKRPAKIRFHWQRWGLIAAALLVSIGVATVYWMRPGPAVLERESELLTEQTLREVEQAEAAYLRSIDKLSHIAAPKLEKPDSALTAAYRDKLRVLDLEIAELRGNIDRNRFNTRLQTELAALYRQKQETLQEIVHREQKN